MDSKPLAGQSALVTGATSGIGRGVAEALALAGAAVAVNYRPGSEEAAKGVCRGIRDRGGEAVPVRADVSVESDVKRMIAETVAVAGALDIEFDEAKKRFLAEKRPHIELKRPGEPDEIAAAVLFLASEKASFILGTNLRVDGGPVPSI